MSKLLEADTFALFVAAVGLASLAYVCFRHWPRLAGVSWLLVVAFVPYWLGVKILINISPASAVGLLVLAALLPVAFPQASPADLLVAFLILVAVVALLLGYGTLTTAVLAVVEWGVGYTLGRVMPLRLGVEWVQDTVAVIFTVVAFGAVLEFLSGVNPFVLLAFGDSSYAVWGTLQERGGQLRVEGAFGHSIALGASLALAVPLVLASRFRGWIRIGMVLVIGLASVFTFSRIGIGCVLIGILLTLVTQARHLSARIRITLLGLLATGAVIAAPLVLRVFAQAGSEATDSSAYRRDLGGLVSQISLFGLSPSASISADGTLRFAGFRSIDSAVVLLGLTYGAIAVLALAALYLAGVACTVTGRATPATVSVVALLPAYLSVALITQYSIFLWFCAGLAVTSQQLRTNGDETARQGVRRRTLTSSYGPRPQLAAGVVGGRSARSGAGETGRTAWVRGNRDHDHA